MEGVFRTKRNRLIALIALCVLGGFVLAAINWLVGFAYGSNPPFAIVGHIVGTMLWGFACGVATRWVR